MSYPKVSARVSGSVAVLVALVFVLVGSRTEPADRQAGTPEATPTSAATRADPARLARDVAWLADDVREGRRAGTAKALECADFLADRLAALGSRPAGTAGFLQEFSVPLAPRTGGGSFASEPGTQARVDEGPDLVPLFCSEGRAAKAAVAFAGFAIADDERGWNDFGAARLDGRIALVVRGVPKRAPKPPPDAEPAQPSPHDTGLVSTGQGWGGNGLLFTKVMNAKRRGAVGVILVPHPDDEKQALLAFGEGGSARAGIPCATLSIPAAKRLLGATFGDWMQGLELGPVAERSPAPRAGPEIELSVDVWRERGPARNVLGLLRGRDTSRCVVVGAHYDHLGLGGEGSLAPAERGQVHNGADDNASGVAAVLEIARLLGATGSPPCDVLIALWSGEELGLLGSDHWCEHPTVPLASIVANVNLDMVGRAGKGKLQVLAAGTAEPFAGILDELARGSGLDVQVSTSGNALGGSSDHATFLKRKIPALHLFTGLHGDYHKPSDDTERFESEGAAKVADLCVALVRRVCAAPVLTFVAPKADPNQKEVRAGFRAWFGSIPNYAWGEPGVLIDGTSPGSPAEHAGLLAGDVLLQIGDVKLGSIYDFTFALQTYKPGDVVVVKFRRDGHEQDARVTLSTRGQQ